MAATYSKHKDRSPEETVERITSILDTIGIETEILGLNHPFLGTYSNRVQIKGTRIGANGKGTTEAYALASGYAELIERIQNGVLAQRFYHAHLHETCGFYHFADERLLTPAELMDESRGIVDVWLERIELTGRDEKLEYLELLPHAMYLSADDKMPAVPYVDVFDGGIAWVPPIPLGSICGSNGLAAGNTMEEALVQALSEIFERHAQNQIATRRLTPPLIPNAYLELAGIRETIEDIEREGRYRVSMFDCSLGLGYPVVASLIVDRFRGTFGFRFGSHPSMAVAMERTLTEAYQGRTAEQSGSANRIGPYEEVTRLDNLKNLLLNGGGAYPGELLAGTPDWEFTPWGDGEDMGNKDFLSYMLGLLRRDGFKVFIRDNSHLGFPAYSVVVPGMGEVISQSLGEKRRSMVLMHALGSFPNITPEEEALLQELAADATDRKGVTLDGLFARPLDGGAMLPARVFGFLQLKHEEFEAASTWFDVLSASSSQPVAAFFWDAMAHYARVRSWGLNREDALALVERLYPRALFRRIVAYTEPEGIMERHFPRMRCRDTYECAGCPTLDEGICNGPAELDLFERIRRAVSASEVKQAELAEALAPYVGR